ncbi:anti-sigma factor [Pseudogracilibacillus auburnensis]|uniref:anti-sigma factor n=1 Tax=Pseudogracilibacillus auburnensis TaxID=1494959 RepID=UPI001A97C123|nr:anti-sigma factor [Pseudogracilibacillus auburnensis]MBO1003210.1 anti sigma factor C-terminal domain-containing protein [Pseudogracilibacillus auburnensis]
MDKKQKQNDEEFYQSFLNESMQDYAKNHKVPEENQKRLINVGRNHALKTNIMITLAILLLIVPVLTLSSHLYYAIGGKANHLIDITTKTIYVTEPNMSLEEMELEEDIGFFTMNIYFDVFKRIGKEDYKAGEYSILFALDKPNFPERDMKLERPLPITGDMETDMLYHPDGPYGKKVNSDWDILEHLPDGTVGEIYLSLNHLIKPEELENQFGNKVKVRWVAVDTGLEDKNLYEAGYSVAPIGYPLQVDTSSWSPFNGEKSNEEVFLDILKFLTKDEKTAEKISRARSLALKERISYIEKNGIQVYGAVVTGPTSELRKLKDNDLIKVMKMGEMKLWNWK